MSLTIRSKGDGVAFDSSVTRGKGGEDVTPIIWSDNYFSLLPGEQVSIRAQYDDRARR